MTQFEFDLIVASLSIVAGMLGALVGLGGGMLIVPLLVIGLGIDIRYAMGAALASVIATSSGAAAAFLRDGLTNLRLGMFLCIATTVGAVSGALLATILPTDTLSSIFGVVLLISVVLSVRGHERTAVSSLGENALACKLRLDGEVPCYPHGRPYHVQNVVGGFCMMIVAGILSGLLGIGSGAFKVLAMDKVMRIPFKISTSTSNFMIGVTAAASVGVYLKRGYLNPLLVFPVALGVLLGALWGAKILPHAPTRVLRVIFLLAVTAIGVQMILRGLGITS